MAGALDPNFPGVAQYPYAPTPTLAQQVFENQPGPMYPNAPPQTPMTNVALQPAGTLTAPPGAMPGGEFMMPPTNVGMATAPPTALVPPGYASDTGGLTQGAPTGYMSPAATEALSDTGGLDQGPRRGAVGAPSVTSPDQPPINVYGDPNAARDPRMRFVGPPTVSEGTGFEKRQTEAGGSAVTVIGNTAVSEQPTAAEPDKPYQPNLRGAPGGPRALNSDGREDRDAYPPVTPRVQQSNTRYRQFSRDNPEQSSYVDEIAKAAGIPGLTLFNLLYANAGSTDDNGRIVIDPSIGMRITPAEAKQLDPEGHFPDLSNLHDQLFLGARKIQLLEARFGRDVASTFAAYKYDPALVDAASRQHPDDYENLGLPGVQAWIQKASGQDADIPTKAVPSTQSAPVAPAGGQSAPAAPPVSAAPAIGEGQTIQGGTPVSLGTAPTASTPSTAPPATTAPAPAAPAAPAAGTPATVTPAPPGQPPVVTPAIPNAPPRVPPIQLPTSPQVQEIQSYQQEPSPPGTPQHVLTGTGSMTPTGLVTAAQGGPQAFMTYMTHNAPAGMNTGDMWRQSANILSAAFLIKGDVVGAQRAQEYVFQQAHVGSTQALMQAYSAMSMGDLQGAAQLMAKAHSFFPDGSAGAFQVQGDKIVGQRFDEHSGQPIGRPFPVKLENIANAMNIALDSQKWLETLRGQQKQVEEVRSHIADEQLRARGQDITQRGQDVTMADVAARTEQQRQYHQDLLAQRASEEKDRNQREQDRIEAQNARKAAELQAKAEHDAYAQQQIRQARIAETDKVMTAAFSQDNYTDPDIQGWSSGQRAMASQMGQGLMLYGNGGAGGVAPGLAVDIAKGLLPPTDSQGQPLHDAQGQATPSRYTKSMTPDGKYVAITDRANPQIVKSYIPTTVAMRYGIITPQETGPRQQTPQPQAQPQARAVPATAIQPPM